MKIIDFVVERQFNGGYIGVAASRYIRHICIPGEQINPLLAPASHYFDVVRWLTQHAGSASFRPNISRDAVSLLAHTNAPHLSMLHACSLESFLKARMSLPDTYPEYCATLLKGENPLEKCLNFMHPVEEHRVVFWLA